MVNISKYKSLLAPYVDVLLFMVCLLVAHFFWKFTIVADEHGGPVYWLGMNISYPFDYMSRHVAHAVYKLVGFTRDTLHFYPINTLRYTNGNAVSIVWSCTALKQAFIWLIIILFARGRQWHKLWFIPLGWACCYAFNIFRIYIIVLFIEQHPDWFEVLHGYIFKYLFYGMMFALWVWWTEKFKRQCQS